MGSFPEATEIHLTQEVLETFAAQMPEVAELLNIVQAE